MSFDAPAPQPLSRLGRAARWYAVERGWRVFPLHSIRSQGSVCSCGKRACTAPGKHPRTPRGCLDATTDVAQITAWWEQWPDVLMDPVPYTKGDIFDAVMFYQAYRPAKYFFSKSNFSKTSFLFEA